MGKILLFTGILASCALAQPPGLVRIVRNGAVQPYVDGNAPANVLGMIAISGPAETWLIELHDSFASLEDVDNRLSAVASARAASQFPATLSDDLLPSSRTLIAVYRPGLSYRPDQAAQVLARMRYLEVTILRIQPGSESDFAKALRLRGIGFDSVNLDRPEMVYQVISGARAGTYLSLAPMTSLRSMDDGRAATPVYAEGAEAAARKIAAETELLRENLWFRVEPRLSFVSEAFAYADAGFWHPSAR